MHQHQRRHWVLRLLCPLPGSGLFFHADGRQDNRQPGLVRSRLDAVVVGVVDRIVVVDAGREGAAEDPAAGKLGFGDQMVKNRLAIDAVHQCPAKPPTRRKQPAQIGDQAMDQRDTV